MAKVKGATHYATKAVQKLAGGGYVDRGMGGAGRPNAEGGANGSGFSKMFNRLGGFGAKKTFPQAGASLPVQTRPTDITAIGAKKRF